MAVLRTRMSFILSAQRDPETVSAAFRRYRDYLASHAEAFPRGAYSLATTDWYFDPKDRRCPHDSWLEQVSISESASVDAGGRRQTDILVRLLGAYHDGVIELLYTGVVAYTLTSPSAGRGLGDWLYDEFRLSPTGRAVHEIEWLGFPRSEGARWVIEASDVEYRWLPRGTA